MCRITDELTDVADVITDRCFRADSHRQKANAKNTWATYTASLYIKFFWRPIHTLRLQLQSLITTNGIWCHRRNRTTWTLKGCLHRASAAALKFWCLGWALGMGLGLILEHHNAFQWDLAAAPDADAAAWRSVCLYPYSESRTTDVALKCRRRDRTMWTTLKWRMKWKKKLLK